MGLAGLPSASQPGDVATRRRPSLDGLDRPLESVVSCSAFSMWFLGRPASPSPVGLALARLGSSCRVMLIQGLLIFLKSVGS